MVSSELALSVAVLFGSLFFLENPFAHELPALQPFLSVNGEEGLCIV